MLRSTLRSFQTQLGSKRTKSIGNNASSPLQNTSKRLKSEQPNPNGPKATTQKAAHGRASGQMVSAQNANTKHVLSTPIQLSSNAAKAISRTSRDSVMRVHQLVTTHLRRLLSRGKSKSSINQRKLPSAMDDGQHNSIPNNLKRSSPQDQLNIGYLLRKREYYQHKLSSIIQQQINRLDYTNGNLLIHTLFTMGFVSLLFRPMFSFSHPSRSSAFQHLFGESDDDENGDDHSNATISKSFFAHNHNRPTVSREENVRLLNLLNPLRENKLFRKCLDGFQQSLVEFLHSNPYLSLLLERVRYPVADEDDPKQRRLRSLYDILIKPYADKFAQTSFLNILTKRLTTGGFTNLEKLHNNALFYIFFDVFVDDEDNTFFNVVFEIRRWVLVIVEPVIDYFRKQLIPPVTYGFLRSVDFFLFLDDQIEPEVRSWIYTVVKNRFKNPLLEDEINYFFTNKRKLHPHLFDHSIPIQLREEEAKEIYEFNKESTYSQNPYRTLDSIKGRNLITDSFGIVVDNFLHDVAFHSFVNDQVFNRNRKEYDETIRDWLIEYALEGDPEPFERFGDALAAEFGFDKAKYEVEAQMVAATLNSDNAYLRDQKFLEFVAKRMKEAWNDPRVRLRYYNLIKNTLTDDEIRDLHISNTILNLEPIEPREQFRSLVVNVATQYGEGSFETMREIRRQFPNAFVAEADIKEDYIFQYTPIPRDYHNWNQETEWFESDYHVMLPHHHMNPEKSTHNHMNKYYDMDQREETEFTVDEVEDLDFRDDAAPSVYDERFDDTVLKPVQFRRDTHRAVMDRVDHFAVSMLLLTYIGARVRDMYAIWNADRQARKDVDNLIKRLDQEVRLLAQTSPEDVDRFAKHFAIFEKNLPPYFSKEIRPLLLSLSDDPADPLHKYYRFPVSNRGVGMNLYGNTPMEFSDNPLIDYYHKVTFGLLNEPVGPIQQQNRVAEYDYTGDITEAEYFEVLKREQGFTSGELKKFMTSHDKDMSMDAYRYALDHPTAVFLEDKWWNYMDDIMYPNEQEFFDKHMQYGWDRFDNVASLDQFRFTWEGYSLYGKYFELYNYSLRSPLKYISLGLPIVTLFNNIFRPGTIYRHLTTSYENRYKPYTYVTSLWGHNSLIAGIFCSSVIASVSDRYVQEWGAAEFYRTILGVGFVSNLLGQITQFTLARLYLTFGMQRPGLLAPNGGMYPVVAAIASYTALKYPDGDAHFAVFPQGTRVHYIASFLMMADLWGAFFLALGRRTGIPHFANLYGWACGALLFQRHRTNPPPRPNVDALEDWQFEFNVFLEPEDNEDTLRRIQFRDSLEPENYEEWDDQKNDIDSVIAQEHYMAGMAVLYRFSTSMDFIAQEETLDRLRKMRVEWRRKFADHDYFNIPRGYNPRLYDRIMMPIFNHSARAASKTFYNLQTMVEKAWQVHSGGILPKDIRRRQFEMHFMFGPLIPEQAVLNQNDPENTMNVTFPTMWYLEGLEEDEDDIEQPYIDANGQPITEYVRMLNDIYINRTERLKPDDDHRRLSDAAFEEWVPREAEAGPVSDAYSFKDGLLYDWELQEDLNEDYNDDMSQDHEAMQDFINKHTKSLKVYDWAATYRHSDVPLDLRIVDEQDMPFRQLEELESTDDWDIEAPFYMDGEYNPFDSELDPTRVMIEDEDVERMDVFMRYNKRPEYPIRDEFDDYFDFEQSIHDQYGTNVTYNDTLRFKFSQRHDTPDGDRGMGFNKFSEINRRNDRDDRNNARSDESTSIRLARDYLGIVLPDMDEWDIDDWGEDYEWWDYMPFEHHNGLVQLF